MLRSFGQFLRDAVIGGLLSLPTVRRMTSGGTKFSVAAVSAEITRVVENRIARYFGDAIDDSFSNEMFGTLRSVDGPLDVPPEKLWVPERDACRHCLAYAGEFEKLNEGFAEGLTFGDKPLTPSAWGGGQIRKPPIHPHCRCDIVPYDSARDIGPVTQAEALKREAQRSILRGWALDSESQPARLRAAERLLRADPAMPATVKDIARRALRRGGF